MANDDIAHPASHAANAVKTFIFTKRFTLPNVACKLAVVEELFHDQLGNT